MRMISKRVKRVRRAKVNKPPLEDKRIPLPDLSTQKIAISDFLLDSISSYDKFASRFLKVQTVEGDLTTFDFNDIQDLLDKIIDNIIANNRFIRLIILKARREGVSTYFAGRFYYKISTNKNRYAMMITHEPEATDFLFDVQKRFQLNMPDFFRPEERYNNKKELIFNNQKGTGLDSAIRVGTAGKEDFGSAQLIHFFHATELAKWPAHLVPALLTSVLQCIPDSKDTEVVFEATAKGMGGEFYNRFWAARYQYEIYMKDGRPDFKVMINKEADESNEYSSVFIPWFVFDKYRRPVTKPLEHTQDERDLISLYNLDDEQLNWRRYCIENKCNRDITIFNQEYPHNPIVAFRSVANSVFPLDILMQLIKTAVPPFRKYNIQMQTGNWLADENGQVLVWQEPIAGKEYIVSADVAEGLQGKHDFSSMDVIEALTGKQVAHWHGKIPPDKLGTMLFYTGKRYNNAIVAPERNNHGLVTITKLSDLGYEKLYVETILEPPVRPRRRYGWLTTKGNKFIMIDNLASEIRDNIHGIACIDTFKEMLTFKQHEDDTLGAEEGHFDDRVMSIAIAKYVRFKHPKFKKYLDTRQSPSYNASKALSKNAVSIRPDAWT